ncbi:hypothetical protein EK21DRAFT_109082 [Setomelanomma holmii]|uniref:Secreted protein n=1 Tax=Setomelanomma holmii TaxID=210430 RepID=A0A9P4LRZ8_9PLEO|nr:hypothetical protein EK21DRAFT_109082 [Setomelanomma holmii]
MINPTAPPTPAPMPVDFVSLLPVLGSVVAVVVPDVTLASNDDGAVGPVAESLALETDEAIDFVMLALVDGPIDAANSIKTALSVLQHLVFSASLSQQYFASLPYPCDPHCQTCTPPDRKSYALWFVGVSRLSWHCCGQSGLAQLLYRYMFRAHS